MKILIINAGSSSLKYQLIDTADDIVKFSTVQSGLAYRADLVK